MRKLNIGLRLRINYGCFYTLRSNSYLDRGLDKRRYNIIKQLTS